MTHEEYQSRIDEAKEELREQVLSELKRMNDYEVVDVCNEYCNEANYPDDHIYSIDEFDDFTQNISSPSELVRMVQFGNFDIRNKYFWTNGYGNLESSNRVADFPVALEDVADYVADNECSLENITIRDCIEEYNDKLVEIEEEYEDTREEME